MGARALGAVARLVERRLGRRWPALEVALGYATRRDLRLRLAPARAATWVEMALPERATRAHVPVVAGERHAVPLRLHGPGRARISTASPGPALAEAAAALEPSLETLALRVDEVHLSLIHI